MMVGNGHDDNIPVIFVKSARGGEIASKLVGYFVIKGKEFRFTAIAFGRIGGHNISLTLAKKTVENIKKMGIDSELLQLTIQRRLIEGDVILPEGLKMPGLEINFHSSAPSSAFPHLHLILLTEISGINSAINFFVFSTFLFSNSITSLELTGKGAHTS